MFIKYFKRLKIDVFLTGAEYRGVMLLCYLILLLLFFVHLLNEGQILIIEYHVPD